MDRYRLKYEAILALLLILASIAINPIKPALAASLPVPSEFSLDELSEASRLQIEQEWKVSDEVVETILPDLESKVDYGGMAIDEQTRKLIIYSTAGDFSAELARLSDGARARVEVRKAVHSQIELEAAAEELVARWTASRTPFVSVGVDLVGQRLRIALPIGSDGPGVEDLKRQSPPVPYKVEVSSPESDTACTSRTNCIDPMKAGTAIRRGSPSEYSCTMGFHVQVGTDEQFLTAGHCGWVGSNNWYHPGLGLIGAETATLYTTNPPAQSFDVMRVQMSDVQDSNLTYGSSGAKSSYRLPIQNESICASLAASNTNRCGTVASTWLAWVSSTCNCTQWGADASYATVLGDSGAPVYAGSSAVGINATTGGNFARMSDAMAAWGIGIRQ